MRAQLLFPSHQLPFPSPLTPARLDSNALRNNLLHPNEYIRGCSLRFLCKLREPEIIEPLVPAVKTCLTHRHPYVRRNALICIFCITRLFPDMYPDAVDDVEKVLEDETDPGARRNAFVMLFNASQDRAIAFLAANTDKVLNFGDGFALILLELIRKLTRAGLSADASGQANKSKFIRIVFALLENPSPAVAFEAASTLTTLSAAAPAIRAAAGAYIKILNKESDSASCGRSLHRRLPQWGEVLTLLLPPPTLNTSLQALSVSPKLRRTSSICLWTSSTARAL